jgi:predicted nucleic-acid-binding protein
MIAVDSNVLLRIALRDDPEQAARAERLLSHTAAQGERIAVSTTAVIESVWAMRKPYKISKVAIVAFLQGLILNRSIHLLERELIVEAAGIYNALPVDFADCIISVSSARAGVAATFSFDADAVDRGLFVSVPA